jgi:hypothetical protein
VAGFLPILEVNFQYLEIAAWILSFDSFQGVLAISTVVESQVGMMQVFGDMIYICVLVRTDDVFVYTESFEDLVMVRNR